MVSKNFKLILNWQVLPDKISSTGTINSYSDFLHGIVEALHKADPKLDRAPSRRKIYPSSPPWWSGECNKIVRVRLAKLKKYLNSSTYENFLDYQKWESKATKKLKSIKSAIFRSFSPRTGLGISVKTKKPPLSNQYTTRGTAFRL